MDLCLHSDSGALSLWATLVDDLPWQLLELVIGRREIGLSLFKFFGPRIFYLMLQWFQVRSPCFMMMMAPRRRAD